MTRQEILRLLQFLKGCYPHARIEDPEGVLAAWELVFGDQEAELVYKAARCHINRSQYFPTPADIKNNFSRARYLFDYEADEKRLTTGQTAKELPANTQDADFDVEEFFRWLFSDE